MKEHEIREKLKEGWLRSIVTFEVAGKPKKHVEDSLKQYLDNLKKDERIIILQEDSEEAIEHEDGVFSTFSECEMLGKNLETYTWLCLNFSPASIEILEPDEMKAEARDITNWMNDLLAKLHDISEDYRNQKASKDHLVIAMNQLIRNSILLSIRAGSKNAKEIVKDIGIKEDQLKPFFENMVKKGEILENNKKYAKPK